MWGWHQGSVLIPLLFTIMMDVVTKEVRAGLLWELLYADALVLVATAREGLCRKLEQWRMSLMAKGL